MAVALLVACATARAQPHNAGKLIATSTSATVVPPIYQRWLDEDVAYIITPEERAAFLKLQTENERDSFVVRFWQRRDPTPDTEENEYKEEHYRRLAFSNEQFAGAQPGWKTDRGRIYIVYGPPDEIKPYTTHVVDGTERRGFIWYYTSLPSYPWEVRYDEGKRGPIPKHDPATFRFVDECGCGNYELLNPIAR